jgi:hypothetical protein
MSQGSTRKGVGKISPEVMVAIHCLEPAKPVSG